METKRRTELLETWALEAGFDRAGAAPLREAESGAWFTKWLERGDHASMDYMSRRAEVRRDPRRLLDGAASALCVALQYYPPALRRGTEGDLWPRVARYARGRDYHNVMVKRLRKLARRVEEAFPGTRTRPYVDTGPVLERDLAAVAGLGVQGKNTMLLHPEAGSYFFLGELITSLELEPAERMADLCGSCTLCLEACPTGALPEAYRLDARRCISYWTIEHRGPVADDMRDQLAGWVFGCDICQEVCPHNEAPIARAEPAFELAEPRRDLDLAGLLALDEETYAEIFRGSPMKRSRREGLRRNACLAMGHSGEQRYVPPLSLALRDADPVVRSHSAWALGRIGGEEALREVRSARAREADPEVLEALETALRRQGESGRDASPPLP